MRPMSEILLYVLAGVLYIGLGIHFKRTRWRPATDAHVGRLLPWERVAILVPLLIHSWLLYEDVFGQPTLRFGFGQALSATLWIAVAFYWVANSFYELAGIQALVLPIAGISAMLPALFAGIDTPPYTRSFEFRIHLTLAMLAYGLFTMAALHAMLMAMVERRLHRAAPMGGPAHRKQLLAGPFAGLPPLLTLEALLFRILALGFAMLTLTLLTGILFSEEVFGQALRFNHKTLFGILSWIVFGGLLLGRRLYGWRGRLALRWTMTGFIVLLLAYVGSRFVLEVLLSRSMG
jgi:ABC-type uncharacterized transport system permease subunit